MGSYGLIAQARPSARRMLQVFFALLKQFFVPGFGESVFVFASDGIGQTGAGDVEVGLQEKTGNPFFGNP